MRHRLIAALALVLIASSIWMPAAQARGTVLAQAEEEEGADQSEAGTDTEGGGETGTEDDLGEGGEGEPGAETGADEGQEAATEEEEGPQWTYQMARITLAMLVLLLLAVAAMYYRMIARRQRGV